MSDDEPMYVVVHFRTGSLPSDGIVLELTVLKKEDVEEKAWVVQFAMHRSLATELGVALLREAGETPPEQPPPRAH
jgi:hypothetical protein